MSNKAFKENTKFKSTKNTEFYSYQRTESSLVRVKPWGFFFTSPNNFKSNVYLLHAGYWNVQVHFTMLGYRLKNYTWNTDHCAIYLAGHCETFHPLNDTLIKEVPLQLLNHLSSECQCFYNLRLVKKKKKKSASHQYSTQPNKTNIYLQCHTTSETSHTTFFNFSEYILFMESSGICYISNKLIWTGKVCAVILSTPLQPMLLNTAWNISVQQKLKICEERKFLFHLL